MKNFKIYRENKLDHIATAKMHIRLKAPVILQKIDDAFVRLYQY